MATEETSNRFLNSSPHYYVLQHVWCYILIWCFSSHESVCRLVELFGSCCHMRKLQHLNSLLITLGQPWCSTGVQFQ
jgi:uncharacterized membrane protein